MMRFIVFRAADIVAVVVVAKDSAEVIVINVGLGKHRFIIILIWPGGRDIVAVADGVAAEAEVEVEPRRGMLQGI
jgi:hypothetical protein